MCVCMLSLLFHCFHIPPRTLWPTWKSAFRKMVAADVGEEGRLVPGSRDGGEKEGLRFFGGLHETCFVLK